LIVNIGNLLLIQKLADLTPLKLIFIDFIHNLGHILECVLIHHRSVTFYADLVDVELVTALKCQVVLLLLVVLTLLVV
jgi:hypothetical protein